MCSSCNKTVSVHLGNYCLYYKANLWMHLFCVGAPLLLLPWATEGAMKISNERPCSLRREGAFPWLLIRNAISFLNHHFLPSAGSMEKADVYSDQVGSWKKASDREVLSPDPFNNAMGNPQPALCCTWNDRNPHKCLVWRVSAVRNQRQLLSVSWSEHGKNDIYLMMLPQGIITWEL